MSAIGGMGLDPFEDHDFESIAATIGRIYPTTFANNEKKPKNGNEWNLNAYVRATVGE